MATNSSGRIAIGASYTLGEYTFTVTKEAVSGSSSTKYIAICRQGSKSARKEIIIPEDADYWLLEANEETADVYVVTKYNNVYIGNIQRPIPYAQGLQTIGPKGASTTVSGATCAQQKVSNRKIQFVMASSSSGSAHIYETYDGGRPGFNGDVPLNSQYTFNGKTVYYSVSNPSTTGSFSSGIASMTPPSMVGSNPNWPGIAWEIVYGSEYEEEKEVIVGRFAIDLEDAGGVGPDSDWDDPGDYDEDWEEGDPTHTLYVTVTGALSGRHNDPIEDPSYSYIPADKDTIKDFGCGGDGGHGGGGGAGASTVVVHKFATNQANSKEVTALAKRHGYGSGGGKGGKGGDGCILVYY